MARETVRRTAASDAPATDIWALASDFAAPWHPWVKWMEMEPPHDGQIVRRFATADDDTLMRERLTYLSHSDRTFSYTALEGIAGADSYAARFGMTEDAGRIGMVWEADIEAAAPRASEIATGTAAVFDAGLAELAVAPPSSPSDAALPRPARLSTLTLGETPHLGLNVAPADRDHADTLCLFLHGIGGNRGNWDAQVATLGSLIPCAALDLRGYGDSTLGPDQTRLDDHFADILAVMGHFNAKRVVLCGLSFGAWIAASFALRNPDKVAGLILCGGCTGMSEASREERDAFRTSRQVPLDAGQTPADFAPDVVNVIAGPDASDEVRRALRASMAAIPTETYRDALTCFTNPPGTLDFTNARFPVLMMTGEHDRLAPPAEIRSVSHRFAAGGAPFVQFEEIAGAGHVCNLEKPEAVTRHIAVFLLLTGLAVPLPTAKEAKKARKHARILDAALKEFSRNGYSGASMQGIAERAGVSKPTLYQYVGQKEDVFRAVLDRGRETILAPLSQGHSRDMIAVLWDFAQAYAAFVLDPDNLAIARLMIAEAERVPDIVRAFQRNGPDRALQGIAAYLAARAKAGDLTLDDPQMAAEHLWSLILSGPRNHALHFPQDLPDQHQRDAFIKSGLSVFLRAYARNPKAALQALEAT